MAVSLPTEAGLAKPAAISERRLITAVYTGFIFTGVVTTLLGPALPTLSAKWSLSDGLAGLLFTAQFAASILGVLATSWWLPRRGHRVILAGGYLLMAVGVGLLGVGVKFLGLPAVFIYGAGMGLTIPASNLLISDGNPERRAAMVSLLNLAWGIGAVACPFFVGLASRFGNLWGSLLGLAAALAITGVVIGVPISNLQPKPNNVPSKTQGRPWLGVPALVLGLLFFLYVGTETALGGWVASHAKRIAESDTGTWVFAPSFFWGALLTGRALAPIFLRMVSEKKLVILDLLMGASGIVVLLAAGSVWEVWMGCAIAGLGFSSVFPINVSLLSSLGPAASRAAGPMFALAGLGGAVIPWLVGLVASASGSLRLALLLPLVAVVIMLWLHAGNAISERTASAGARIA